MVDLDGSSTTTSATTRSSTRTSGPGFNLIQSGVGIRSSYVIRMVTDNPGWTQINDEATAAFLHQHDVDYAP